MSRQSPVWTVGADIATDYPGKTFFFDSVDALLDALTKAPDHPSVVVCSKMPERECPNFFRLLSICNRIPLIAIFNRTDERAFRDCFDRGVCEIFINPVDPILLKVKIDLIQRSRKEKPTLHSIAEHYVIDPLGLTICLKGGKTIQLTPKEMQILVTLSELEKQGITVTAQNLRTKVWKNASVTQHSLHVHLHKLRTKLNPIGINILFHTSNGFQIVLTHKNHTFNPLGPYPRALSKTDETPDAGWTGRDLP